MKHKHLAPAASQTGSGGPQTEDNATGMPSETDPALVSYFADPLPDAFADEDDDPPSRKKNRRQKLDRKRAGKMRDADW
ncbi:MAG: hypothetical protein AB7E47_05125 [Desulfovibrionaceae bacterium]